METNKHKGRKLFIPKMLFLALSVSQVLHAAETAAPAAPTWGLDPATGTILKPGISVMSLGTLTNPGANDGDHSFKLFDTSNINPTDLRPLETPDVHTHHHWDVGSVGNIFGLAIDKNRNIYATASTHFGSGYYQGGSTKIGYGAIGAGTSNETAASDDDAQVLNDLSAAGTIYKINAVTGNATVFAQLPQQAASFNQQNCEGPESIARNTGPGLGNIAYDEIHNIFFVSNFEDGKIYRLSSAGTILNSFDPFAVDDNTAGLATDARPYGLAVNLDGTKLYFGTHELNQTPRLFAIDLDASGNFSGSEVNQNATLGTDLAFTQNVGGGFAGGPNWVAYSDMKFSPQGELMIGVRTGCKGNFATSHNHGGTYYLLVQDGSGLYNTPAPQVPGSASSGTAYDAGSFPIQYRGDTLGPGDGYGGVAIYDKGSGEYDYLVTSGDIEAEPGPHGFLLFPESFTVTGNNSTEFLIRPGAAFSGLPSSTSAGGNDYKGIGGDIEVLSVLTDWGDAPDSYSTDLLVGNSGADVRGPSHIIAGDGVFLGASVDDEANGAPSTGANGDDTTDTPDDEDGISAFPALNSADLSYTIPIANITTANASGADVTLHAWVDFDGNGVFDVDEYASTIAANGVSSPSTDLHWSGLSGLTSGITYARFRITNDPAITAATPGERASNGEVEDYALIIDFTGPATDWGDAPAAYLTTLADNGPRHELDSALYLGACVDDDYDGQLTVSNPANGDNVGMSLSTILGTCASGSDEDSLTPPTLINGQAAPTLEVTVNNTTGGDAYLACWVDYSGSAFDVVERTTTVVVPNNATSVLVTFPDVPATASATTGGASYMRCRLASDESEIANPTGLASNGEIEDYPISILEVGSGPSQDWGDAPNSAYLTVSASDGPRHNLDATLFMGNCVDDEIDGQQSVAADGDDSGVGIVNTHGSCALANDDEDSLTPPALTDGDLSPTVTVAVSNTTGSDANLACWVDYNGAGFDPAERSSTVVVANNATSVNVTLPNVPLTASADTGGSSFMRCRLATNDAEIIDPTGLAENGEVEDYPVSIAGVAPIGLTIGNRLWLDTNANGLDDSEPAVNGATVVLYDGVGTELSSTTTDANGNYIFTGLAADNYKVCVKNTNFQSGGVLEGNKSTVTVESLPNHNVDGNDNGLSANESVDGICSGILTLAAASEPTGEPEGSLGSGGVSDTDANLTVDFGFVTATVPGPQICDVTGATATDGTPNSVVDNNDLIWIYQHKGTVASPSAGAAGSGDYNGDGIISINDFGGCRTHLGSI